MEEVWKVYKTSKDKWGNPRVYEVSNYGNARINGIVVQPKIQNSGYYMFAGGLLHRAVAELFVSNPSNKPQIDHIDGNKLNNHYTNLQWVTPRENMNNKNTVEKLKVTYLIQRMFNLHNSLHSEEKMWIHKGEEEKRINPCMLEDYINLGWEKGHSSSSKEKVSKARKDKNYKPVLGRKWMNDGINEYFVFPEDIQDRLSLGWSIGRL